MDNLKERIQQKEHGRQALTGKVQNLSSQATPYLTQKDQIF